jgi:hypothetical protein
MADEWQSMSAAVDGNVSSSTEWNKYISNANLLREPNTCWVRADGDEPTQVMYFDIKTTNKIRYLEATMVWSGQPLLVAYSLLLRADALPETVTVSMKNDYNSDSLTLIGEGISGVKGYPNGWTLGSALTISGMQMWSMTPPADPVEISFYLEVSVAATNAAIVASLNNVRPGFLVVEFPK